MILQELPKTAAETTMKLVRYPVDLVTKVREAVEEQFGGDNDTAETTEPAVEPTKVKAAKPKATKKPAAAKTTAPRSKPKAATAAKTSAVDRAQSERRKLES
jgi:hypothetical protein